MFGTALNRFCVQAVIGHPLTVYGKGGQTRGFLNIRDTLQCVELAVNNPADAGRVPRLQPVHRAVHGLRAGRAGQAGRREARLRRRDPVRSRTRASRLEDHYYNAVNTKLRDLGLQPHYLGEELVQSMLKTIERYKDRVIDRAIAPRTRWKPGELEAGRSPWRPPPAPIAAVPPSRVQNERPPARRPR